MGTGVGDRCGGQGVAGKLRPVAVPHAEAEGGVILPNSASGNDEDEPERADCSVWRRREGRRSGQSTYRTVSALRR